MPEQWIWYSDRGRRDELEMYGIVKYSAAKNRQSALSLLDSLREDGDKKAAVYIQNNGEGRIVRLQATEAEIQAACEAHSSNWTPDPEEQAKRDAWNAKRASYGIPDDYEYCLGEHSVLLRDSEGKPILWGFWLSGWTTEEMDRLNQWGKVVAIKKRMESGQMGVCQALATERVKNGVIVRTRKPKKVRLKDLRRW